MNRDFYTTLAQVLPVLLLALMFDSGFLVRLRTESRDNVWFWTKPRVRAYILFVVLLTVGSTGVALFVLAGMLPDTLGLRIALIAAAVVVLATLLTRVGIDVILATAPGKAPAGDKTITPGKAPAGDKTITPGETATSSGTAAPSETAAAGKTVATGAIGAKSQESPETGARD